MDLGFRLWVFRSHCIACLGLIEQRLESFFVFMFRSLLECAKELALLACFNSSTLRSFRWFDVEHEVTPGVVDHGGWDSILQNRKPEP